MVPERLTQICSGSITSGSSSVKGFGKNPNLFLLLRVFVVSDDWEVIRVADYPRFTGKSRDIKGSSNLSGLRYSRAFFSARLCGKNYNRDRGVSVDEAIIG